MDPDAIDDAIRRGRGLAAIAVGRGHVLHRPRGPHSPAGGGTATMRLPAQFVPATGRDETFGHPLHEGIFDSAYTQAGDYLVGNHTWFVACQAPLLPVLCVKATRVLTIRRAEDGAAVGLGEYGGLRRDAARIVLSGWPASVVSHGGGMERADLPGDTTLGGWSVLMPSLREHPVRTGDLVTDDLGRAGVIASAELSDLGWRLFVRQAAT